MIISFWNGATTDMYSSTRLVGNGNPHHNYFHKQVSLTRQCVGKTCSLGPHETNRYSFRFSADKKPAQWIPGDFPVTPKYSTGGGINCTAAANHQLCVWIKVAHTAYTVQDWAKKECGSGSPKPIGKPYVIKSPNKNNEGGSYYCVIGTCREKGDGYWE
ncbi:uncharacterized protein K452DRAFT_341682 [Aplosporella prunicola CBS 121167]|uniref:Uncharacterized protein n=1 Tax=Aplosporella prunicola CBS 121167 TaxID=1176127 RepID=A0A6A6AYU1_9PEZI|nr:uncharacterized protein K452DRAFT_341682 [Aplosporella prunicola CBS 121167]KAF2137099.1 hypothetical protein K452DRAFT_341682 [Aplosporella prunicola CBS 121167]